MVIVLVVSIVLFVAIYNGTIDTQSFIRDNDIYIKSLKEKDYDFYVNVRYGDDADPNKLFYLRLRNSVIGFMFIILVFLSNLNFINFVVCIVLAYLLYKMQYVKLRNFYKKRLYQIDQLLPYYLKNLEILAQHYTIPIALQRSIDDAPEIFRSGLRKLVGRIDAGDSTIDPYMDFARTYPVRDSMRMMRLLYRLGIGEQERKYEQLLMFARTVSSLQNKTREQKYKARLDSMEKRTIIMLVVTGGGTMIILLLSMLMMFTSM